MLPVTTECVAKIKGASVIPVGVAPQFTIDANGDRKVKRRTTHDTSFVPPSKQSINERMRRDLLVNYFYGYCVIRILHSIHIMRWTCTNILIYISKLDLNAVYQRLHMLESIAAMTIAIVKKIAYILLCLPFGVADGPNDFRIFSEPIIDLTNDILRDTTWSPTTLHSPLRSEFDPPKKTINKEADIESKTTICPCAILSGNSRWLHR